MDDKQRIADLEQELQRAYRALIAYQGAYEHGKVMGHAAHAYHALAVGAAKRFVWEEALDGTAYFIGKPVDVLHTALKLGSESAKA